MSKTLYEVAREFIPEESAMVLIETNETLKSQVKSFSDPKIAGTQCLIDYFLFRQGNYPYTLDVTQFFRLNEPFNIGYSVSQEVITPVVAHTMSREPKNQEYKNFLDCYTEVLQSGGIDAFLEFMNILTSEGSKKSRSLLEKKFLETPKETPLFRDKKVVVTGSNTGIGREIALEFARRGARVVLHYPTEQFSRGALSAVELIQEYGGSAQVYRGDFRRADEIYSFANNVFRDGVDILINDAGITLSKPFEETSFIELRDVVSVNLVAQYLIAQKAVRHMERQGKGVIINMSSNHGIAGKAGHSVYAMTKAGILGLTRELAMEYARKGIRVNAIIPGGVMTESHLRLMPNFAELKGKPIQNWNNPEDIAKVIAYYCSDETRNVTGQQIIVDGGMSAALTGGGDATEIPEVLFGRRFLEQVNACGHDLRYD